ncbi:MAG: S-layer homology domain-containing protein [Oscillospiraceae bacterium]|nr:S-layer homology domain-containing protein [Oscillospiraceae bacterium]
MDEETGAITYEFTPASHGAGNSWVERRGTHNSTFLNYPGEPTDEECKWAYLGTTTYSHNSGGYHSYISGDNGLFTQMTVPADGWLAVKIYVPEDGVYEISGTAYSNSGTSKQEMYILPAEAKFDYTNEATYGAVEYNSTTALYERKNAPSFTQLQIPDSAYVGWSDIYASPETVKELDNSNYKRMKLSQGDYIVILRNATEDADKRLALASLTLTPVPLDTTGEVEFIFNKESHNSTSSKIEFGSTWDAAYIEYREGSDNIGYKWAYRGSTTYSHNTSGYMTMINDDGLFTQMTVPADGWLAIQVYVPESGIYNISGTAYTSSSSCKNQAMYMVPMDEEISAKFAKGNTDVYGEVYLSDETDGNGNKLYLRSGAKSFAELGISEDYRIGSSDIYTSNTKINEFRSLNTENYKETELKKGDYILLLRNDTEKSGCRLSIGKLKLSPRIALTCTPGFVLVGNDGKLSCVVKDEWGVEIKDAVVTYSTTDTDIISLDNSEKTFRGINAGTAEIKAEATVGEKTLYGCLSVEVKHAGTLTLCDVAGTENDPIARYSIQQVEPVLNDQSGEIIKGDKLAEAADVVLHCIMGNEDIGGYYDSDDGKWYIDFCGEGSTAEVYAEISYPGKDKVTTEKKTYYVAEAGRNLMSDDKYNSDFERGEGNWPWAAQIKTGPKNPGGALWNTIELAEDPTIAGNHAVKYTIYPDVSANDEYERRGATPSFSFNANDGNRIKVTPGKLYTLSFDARIKDWIKPASASHLQLNVTLYPYTANTSAGKLIAGAYDIMNPFAETDFVEKYSENGWVKVSVPVLVPQDGVYDGYESIYLQPSIGINTPNADASALAGYGGELWLDNIEIREVGFKDIEMVVDGDISSGAGRNVSVSLRPRTSTDDYISIMDYDSFGVDFNSSDTDIISDIGYITTTETFNGSSHFYGSAEASLGGINGRAVLTSKMTINGVTREGVKAVDVTGFTHRLFGISAKELSLQMGENPAGLEISGLMTDKMPADLTNADITYRSLTPDIVSVDNNGVVTPVGIGEGIISVSALLDGVMKSCEVKVPVAPRDGDEISDVLFYIQPEIQRGREEIISLGMVTKQGNNVYPSYFTVCSDEDNYILWDISSAAADKFEIIDNERIKANADVGTTASITASGRFNGTEFDFGASADVKVIAANLLDYTLNFEATQKNNAFDVNLAEDGWEIDREASELNSKIPTLNNMGMSFIPGRSGTRIVIKINIPHDGYYKPIFMGRSAGYQSAENVDIYVDGVYAGNYCFYYKGATFDIPPETYRAFYLEEGTHTFSFNIMPNYMTVINPEGVEQNLNNSYHTTDFRSIRFTAVASPAEIEAVGAGDNYSLMLGTTQKIGATIEFSDGISYEWKTSLEGTDDDYMLTYDILDGSEYITVSEAGEITAGEVAGAATVKITAWQNVEGDWQAKKEKNVSVMTYDGAVLGSIKLIADSLAMKPDDESGRTIRAVGYTLDGTEVDISGRDDLVWEYDSVQTVVSFTHNAANEIIARPHPSKTEGEVKVTAKLDIDANGEVEDDEQAVAYVTVTNGKAGRTFYTDERVANARENIQKYDWAKAEMEAVVDIADKYVELGMEYVWKMLVGEGVPRAIQVGNYSDQYQGFCRYCGAEQDIYPWTTSMVTRPWKIQCPDCKRLFPSNDFSKFYELGIGDDGIFSRKIALEKHHKMFVCPDGENCTCTGTKAEEGSDEWYKYYGYGLGYLKNDTYKELYTAGNELNEIDPFWYNADLDKDGKADKVRREFEEGYTAADGTRVTGGMLWGVDDGYGYRSRFKDNTGKPFLYNYIAYYNHQAFWWVGEKHIYTALSNLSLAYVYTGDKKYGNLGAILVDRLADVYAEFDVRDWSSKDYKGEGIDWKANGHYAGAGNVGKMTNYIWEAELAGFWALAYDAFWDRYDDPEVVEFIQNKAYREYPGILQHQVTGEARSKATPGGIRETIEKDLIWEIFESAKCSDVYGNFGMSQEALAQTAVVYDREPGTTEIVDYIFADVVTDGRWFRLGDGAGRKFVDDVDRDGFGYESSGSYNQSWVKNCLAFAEALALYKGEGYDLWRNPKFVKMYSPWNAMQQVHRGQESIGDQGLMGSFRVLPDQAYELLVGFKNIENTAEEIEEELEDASLSDSERKELEETRTALRDTAARIIQLVFENFTDGGDFLDMHYDIFTKNPESVQQDAERYIEEYGEYDWDKSALLAGYGFASLRGGSLYESVGAGGIRDTTHDFWMYFGGGETSHKQLDGLNIGINAYGISVSSDNGYPEYTGAWPHRQQYTRTTLAHNTVVVNEKNQVGLEKGGETLHFEAKDSRVKLMDVDYSDVYVETDEYRRTVVSIDYDDEVSYGIDFFKVLGGNDHIYSFHASSDTVYDTNLSLTEQKDNNGNFIGTYAGADVPFGDDPWSDNSNAYKKLKYPLGYTWYKNIRKDENPNQSFFVDYNIKDVMNLSRNPKNEMDIHLRVTAVNDWNPDEVTLSSAVPNRKEEAMRYIKEFEYMFIRRKGETLDTLFTTVLEPYNKERYIKNIERIDIARKDGSDIKANEAVALKITLCDGRVDYVTYATDTDMAYTITDNTQNGNGYSFDFQGFVGVWTLNGEEKVYSYLHDGTLLADVATNGSLEGTVKDFTRELSFSNKLEVEFDRTVSGEEMQMLAAEDTGLAERLIVVEHPEMGQVAYTIKGVEFYPDGEGATIDLGDVTTIASYKDYEAGTYNYYISEDAPFVIPISYEDDRAPVFEKTSYDATTSAGSTIKVNVSAVSQIEEGDTSIAYAARTLPRGASLNEDGTVTWKPDASQVGENLVAVDATDSLGRTSTMYFVITVYGSTTGKPSTENTGTQGEGTSGGGGGGGGAAPETSDKTNNDETDTSDESLLLEEKVPSTGEADEVENGNVPQFVDLDNHAWAADAINSLADEGIIKGTSENTFSPANNITRADFALLLVRAFKLSSDDTENFADVSASDYFASELAVARNTGIVNGIGDNKYAPRNTITRQDMMVIVYRALQAFLREEGGPSNDGGRKMTDVSDSNNVALGSLSLATLDSSLPEGASAEQYPDYDTIAPYAQDAVSALIGAGLVNGKNGHIAPTDYTTRAEVSVLVKRILEYIKMEEK